MKPVKHFSAFFIFVLAACAASNDIRLEKVSATSDRLECDKVFAVNRDSIVQLNQIMIQTGVVDTSSDATPFKASVINIDGQELILNLVKANHSGENYKEQYAGKGYKLMLDYNSRKLGNSIIYEGDCELWHGKEHTKLGIEGINNNL